MGFINLGGDMKLSQKKNCNGCMAGWYSTQPFTQHCDLGVKVDSRKYEGVPKEPCYKPMRSSDVILAREFVGL